MSFFLPRRLPCFLCDRTIGERVEAARLFYAHPDDVGEVARHGRAWVHRACWNGWALRELWADSAVRLLATDEHAVRRGDVVIRRHGGEALLQDPWLAVQVAIPAVCERDFVKAARSGGVVQLHADTWTFEAGWVNASSSGEIFEQLELPEGRWIWACDDLRDSRG